MGVGAQSPGDVTELLQRWNRGDQQVAGEVVALVYEELKRIAESQFRREPAGHTLQATVIVHEAYLRLCEAHGLRWENRSHFYGLAAHLMRRILVDHARGRNRLKRGGRTPRGTMTEALEVAEGRPVEVIAVDDALRALEKLDPRKAAVVELRFFAGLTLEEIAVCLGISLETAGREWRRARAWLHDELGPGRGVRHGR